MPSRPIAGSRFVVTGASSGIGRAVALELARQGADLLITARRKDRLLALAVELVTLGRQVAIVAGDITDSDVRQQIVHESQQQLGGMDVLVNNAGIGAIGSFAEADDARLRRILDVNFIAPVELTRIALPVLRQSKHPLVANVGSVLGHVAVPDKSEYCASKFALHGWTDALREELAAEGIDVLLVSPSTTASEFFDSVIDKPTGQAKRLGPFHMASEKVARRIVNAIRRGRREIILPLSGRMLVWSDRLFPGVVSWWLRKQPLK